MAKRKFARISNKVISSQRSLIFVAILALFVFIGVWAIGKGNIFKRSGAANPISLTFSPSSANMPPNRTFSLMVNTNGQRMAYAYSVITFDPSKIRLASEITTSTAFETINQKTSMATANSSGRIVIGQAVSIPQRDANTYPSGSFELAQLTFTAVSQIANDRPTIQLVALESQYITPPVDPTNPTDAGEVFPVNFTAPTIVLNPAATTTPMPTASPTSTPVVTSTPRPTIVPTMTATPMPTATATVRPTVTPTASPTAMCRNTGGILREYWDNMTGSLIPDLVNNPNYPSNPSGRVVETSFEGAHGYDTQTNYGERYRGYVCPPITGLYTFWIASDDRGQLFLSSSASESGKSLIASVDPWVGFRVWDRYAGQKSQPVSLIGGQAYYIEVLHKQGVGGYNMSVAWEGPSIARNVISGNYLVAYTVSSPTTTPTAIPTSTPTVRPTFTPVPTNTPYPSATATIRPTVQPTPSITPAPTTDPLRRYCGIYLIFRPIIQIMFPSVIAEWDARCGVSNFAGF